MSALPECLEEAVASGLMTRAAAEEANAFSDELAAYVSAGEITLEQAESLAAMRGEADAASFLDACDIEARKTRAG